MTPHNQEKELILKAVKKSYYTEIKEPLTNTSHLCKPSPIPIVRINLPNFPQLRKKLAIHGHKYFSKFNASGPETSLILKNAKKSCKLKYNNSLEFDPYLCDESCIKELSKCFKRFKNTKKLNIIFRKGNILNETDLILPFFYKHLRMSKLRLELAGTANIDEDGLIRIYHAIRKRPSLRIFHYYTIETEALTIKSDTYFHKALISRLERLEEFSYYDSVKKGVVKQGFSSEKPHRHRDQPHMKRFYLAWNNVGGEWTSLNGQGESGLETALKGVTSNINLYDVRFKNIRSGSEPDLILILMQAFGALPSLRHFEYEFLGSRLTDQEAILFGYGISKMPQLESFVLKIIQ